MSDCRSVSRNFLISIAIFARSDIYRLIPPRLGDRRQAALSSPDLQQTAIANKDENRRPSAEGHFERNQNIQQRNPTAADQRA